LETQGHKDTNGQHPTVTVVLTQRIDDSKPPHRPLHCYIEDRRSKVRSKINMDVKENLKRRTIDIRSATQLARDRKIKRERQKSDVNSLDFKVARQEEYSCTIPSFISPAD